MKYASIKEIAALNSVSIDYNSADYYSKSHDDDWQLILYQYNDDGVTAKNVIQTGWFAWDITDSDKAIYRQDLLSILYIFSCCVIYFTLK